MRHSVVGPFYANVHGLNLSYVFALFQIGGGLTVSRTMSRRGEPSLLASLSEELRQADAQLFKYHFYLEPVLMKRMLFRLKRYLYGLAVLLMFILIPQVALAQDSTAPSGFLASIEAGVQRIVDVLNLIFYFKVGGENGMPFIVLWLALGAVFFTLRLKFINIPFGNKLDTHTS